MNIEFADFQPFLLILACIGLCISLCTEQSQIVAKTRGAFAGKIATGYMSAMKIMILNRAGAILYVFFVSLCIDTGVTNQTLLTVTILSCFGVMIYNITLVINRRRILAYQTIDPTERLWKFLFEKDGWYSGASFFATFCNVLGLTLPFLLSNTFPEYRLTMANTGFLLNIFFTMINVMILENRYAYILDHDTNADAYYFVVKVFLARALAMLTAVIFLGLLMLWIT